MRAGGEMGPLLLVGNFLSQGRGTTGVCEELAVKLTEAGWTVLTTSNKPGRASRLADMLTTVWRRRHEYAVAHVDVYSGSAFVWAESVCVALRAAGKPYVLTLHGGLLPAFAERWPRRVRNLLTSASAVTTPSRYLREHLSHLRQDLLLLPNPIELKRYRFRCRERPEPRLVWVRAFHEIYNPQLVPPVVAILAERFPTVSIAMVGPDKDGSLNKVLALARSLGVASKIEMVGAVPKSAVPGWLDRGDVFINTTNVDNTPVTLLEALACGLPVVSTRVGGIPYMVDEGRNALLVPPGDAAAMAAAVERILCEPGLSRALSACARETAAEADWSKVMPRWERLFHTLIQATDARQMWRYDHGH